MRPNFAEIRERCHGFMTAGIYSDLYDFSAGALPGEAVEVGCAHGASTVCIGLGMGDAMTKLTTFGRFGAGRRAGYRDPDRNYQITIDGIAHYGLENVATVVDGDAEDKLTSSGIGRPVTMVFLDADGRIDRDLLLLRDYLAPVARIAIDDYADRVRLTRIKDNIYTAQQKHRLTKMLVDSAKSFGVLHEDHVNVGTWFGFVDADKIDDWPADEILKCYARLIKLTIEF